MKKALIGLLVAGLAVPALGVGINITEGWESWDHGTVPGSPWTTPASINFSTFTPGFPAWSSNGAKAGSKALLVNNNYGSGTNKGLQQTFGLGAGESVLGTDDAPLTLSYWTQTVSTGRKPEDFYVELSLGDVHAPAFGTVLEEAIPVIAFSKPYTNNVQFSWFNGKQWLTTGHSQTATNPTGWDQLTMVLNSTQATLSGPVGSTINSARMYLGGFDRISIRTAGNNTSTSWALIDELSLTGGNVVPEPATAVMLLGLGGLFLRRRVR